MQRLIKPELRAVVELLMKAERVDLLMKPQRVELSFTDVRLRDPPSEDRVYLDTLSRVAGRLAGMGGERHRGK